MPLLATPPSEIQVLADGDVQRILKVQHPLMSGNDVRQVQRKLVALGYSLPQYGIDGVYGEETEMAVKHFQQDNKLSITGMVGPSTWKALQQDSGSTLSTIPGLNNIAMIVKEFWSPLPTSQKVLYGIGGTALIGGIGIAIYNTAKN